MKKWNKWQKLTKSEKIAVITIRLIEFISIEIMLAYFGALTIEKILK